MTFGICAYFVSIHSVKFKVTYVDRLCSISVISYIKLSYKASFILRYSSSR